MKTIRERNSVEIVTKHPRAIDDTVSSAGIKNKILWYYRCPGTVSVPLLNCYVVSLLQLKCQLIHGF
jgi:hypothetical protein